MNRFSGRAALIAAPIAAMLALGGCALGPDYKTPDSKAGEAFENAAGNGQEPPREFWRRFDDPVLNALVEDALKANHDIRIAVANLREARAIQRAVDAEAFPLFGSSLSGKRRVIPQTDFPGPRSARTGDAFDASLDANWEANLLGRYTRGS